MDGGKQKTGNTRLAIKSWRNSDKTGWKIQLHWEFNYIRRKNWQWYKEEMSKAVLRLSMKTKLIVLYCYIDSTLTYGGECWKISQAMEKRLQSVKTWFYRRMLRISWTDHMSNEEVLVKAGKRTRLRWDSECFKSLLMYCKTQRPYHRVFLPLISEIFFVKKPLFIASTLQLDNIICEIQASTDRNSCSEIIFCVPAMCIMIQGPSR